MGKYKEGRDLFDSYELFEDLADNPVSRTYRISVSALINFVTSKREEAINDINAKIELINAELKDIEESGFVEFVKVKTKEMVYAYDMQNYVRLHPEKFNNKK